MNWLSLPPALMAAVSTYVGVYYLWLHVRRRSEPENLAFAAASLSIALYDVFCAGLYNAASPGQGIFWQRGQFAILALFVISVSWFIYHFISYRSRAPFIAITAVMSAFLLTGLLVDGELTLSPAHPFVKVISLGILTATYNEVDPGIIYTLQYGAMLCTAGFLFYQLVKSYRQDEQVYARPILVSMVLIFGAGVNDVLVGAGVYPFVYLLEYAYLFIILSMAYVLQERFIMLNREVEELTLQLEEKVDDRTMELFLSEIARDLYAGISGDAGDQAGKDGATGTSVRTLSQDVSIIMNFDRLLKRSLEKAVEISGSDAGWLYMAGGSGLDLAAQTGSEAPSPYISSTAAEVMNANRYCIDAGNTVTGVMCLFVPVNVRERAFGVCCFQRSAARGVYSERELRVVTAFIGQASSAMENAYLYQRMVDRNETARRHAVTPGIEEKMKKAMAYINENYKANISREGLAASINMHPDSFGRFFKIYTGRKISEYINELRVIDTAAKLRETDRSIIDIAFDAGFESLPTFNRAFLKIMKATPTQYREKGK